MDEVFSTSQFRLIPQSREMLQTMESVEDFKRFCGAEIKWQQLTYVRPLVEQSLDFYEQIEAEDPWIGYLAMANGIFDFAAPQIVGCGGFKGNPDAQSAVEIAYHTFAEYETRGIGTRIAAELVRIAHSRSVVRIVLAHTLPERNASCRILQNNHFEWQHSLEDPTDGKIWRWQLRLPGP